MTKRKSAAFGYSAVSTQERKCHAGLARTDANSAHLLTADIDPYDRIFLTGERTVEGFYGIHGGLDSAIARGLAYAPYCDLRPPKRT